VVRIHDALLHDVLISRNLRIGWHPKAMTPDRENKNAAPPLSTHVEPPKIYHAACGAVCDIFWWARRDPPAEDPAATVRSS
jgi:hypothetical protein